MSEAEDALSSGFYAAPILVVDPRRHTALIKRTYADTFGRFAVTASDDKTVRVWSLADGEMLRVIRLPSGPGFVGQAQAVAIDPAGEIIAVGGYTQRGTLGSIYLFERETGALRYRISSLIARVFDLAFSPDGRHLAAAASFHGDQGMDEGICIFGRDENWSETAVHINYAARSYAVAFAPDGRLAATSVDGFVWLYGSDFRLQARSKCSSGEAYGIAFSPDGKRIAVGFNGLAAAVILDAHSLAPQGAAAAENIGRDLSKVAWATNDTLLGAGRRYRDRIGGTVVAWDSPGHGKSRPILETDSTVMSLRSLPGGDALVATGHPWLIRVTADGQIVWKVAPPLADMRGQQSTLAVSPDGAIVDFGFEEGNRAPARFDVSHLALTMTPEADGCTTPPREHGEPVDDWHNLFRPTLASALQLLRHTDDVVRSFALHPDSSRFVLGTDWTLRAFDAAGTQVWWQRTPIVWAVNVTGDGRLVVTAHGDGTIRWHRMDDGREILAFMPLSDRSNWVAWTPEGFYAASPGAHGVLRWRKNQPDWQPAKDYAVADISGFYRPETIKLVLQEMETPRAFGLAGIAEQRKKVLLLTHSSVPPGARLHVLAIGISHYDQEHLRLSFAQQDAYDVLSALTNTQDALWVAGSRQYVVDGDAKRASIRRSLDTLYTAMTGKEDLAVIHFSGHGAMVDGELYLLPQDVQAGDAVALKDSALPMIVFRTEVERIAERGRVLVLLDACYSGSASRDGRAAEVSSSVLSIALAGANINVITSSSASQASREKAAWQNGAFTEAVLEAFGEADTNYDGLISANEFADYVERRVRSLTDGNQSPAMEVRFGGTLFAVQMEPLRARPRSR